ncbi:hypothetical protein D9M72_577530 [compost metagenome]
MHLVVLAQCFRDLLPDGQCFRETVQEENRAGGGGWAGNHAPQRDSLVDLDEVDLRPGHGNGGAGVR